MTDIVWEVFVWEGPVAADGYGQLLAQVPGWQAVSIAPLGNAVGAGQISLPLDSPVFWQNGDTPETTPVLSYETLWQVVQTDISAGTPAKAVFEFLAQSVDRTTVESDETRTVTVSGPGTAQCLNWGMAMPFGWTPSAGGFVGVTGAIQDSFDEQEPDGTFDIDTALWNLSTAGACTIPDTTASYTQATAPAGTIQINAVWYDTSTKPPTEYIWDGNYWSSASSYSGSAGGGSVQVALSPSGGWLAGGSFNFSNSSFSASISPAQPYNPAAPGCPLDQDPCDGSDVTQMIVKPASGQGYALIGLSYQSFYCEYLDNAGNLQTFVVSPGRYGGTGGYNSSWAQYWRISCDLQANGNKLLRYWSSGDGSTWTLQWTVNQPGSSAWDPSLVNVYLGGTYNTTGANGAYAQFSSINGEIQANADAGPIYITTPAMAIMYDQISRIKARGTFPFINPTYSATTDSDGNTWADTWSVQVPIGTDMLSAQQNYAGAVDSQWYMQPGYNLYTGLNPGRQLQNSITWHEGEITQYGRTQTRDQIYNVAVATDGAGMIWTELSSESIEQWAQRETFVMSGGTIDAQSAVNTAQAAVEQWDDEVDARILQIPPNADGKTAFVDFQIFDWIGVERSDFSAADTLQVIGITVTIDQDGAETHEVVVNTYRQVMAQWFAYLMNKFGGQAASTLGALTPGTTAGSAFTLAIGPNLAVSPAQTGGSGSSKASALGVVSSLASTPEVAAAQTPSGQTAAGSGASTSSTSQIIPGSLVQDGTLSGTALVPASVPEEALSFTLPSGSKVTFSSTAPAGPAVGDLWYNTSSSNALSQWNGTTWTAYQFGVNAISATAAQLGGVQTYVQSTAPTGSINAGSQWYDTAAGNALYVYESGSWVVQPFGAGAVNFTAVSIGGVNVYLQSTAPTGSINAGSLWYDSSNGYLLNIYNGSAWTAYAFGTSAISSGSVTTGLLAASAVTAAKIAAGAVTATQLAAGSVTAASIASGTVTAAQIAAGTITSTQLAAGTITALDLVAGIVIAGAVNGTTVTGATMIADGSSGQFLIYSGTPEAGNLIGSWSGFAGSDGYGNEYPAGLSVQQGAITGLDIDNTSVTGSTWTGGTITEPGINDPQVTGGTITETEITFDDSGGVLLVYTSSTVTTSITASGTSSYTVPADVTQAKIECWAAGQGGDGGKTSEGGSSGYGGSYACEPDYSLTPGDVITVINGTAGSGGVTGTNSHGANGGDTLFNGVGGVHAIGGGNTALGYGPFNSVSYAGGASGSASGNSGGASGGNSGCPTAAGNAGAASTGSTGHAAPAAQTGGGQGAPGGSSGSNANTGGSPPGGGGGGAGQGSANNTTVSLSPTWAASYYGPDASSNANAARSTATLYQGQSSRGGGATSGSQRAIMEFNAATVHSGMSGQTPYQAYLNITNEQTSLPAGMILEVSYPTVTLGGAELTAYPTGDTMTHVVDWFVPAGGTISIPLGPAFAVAIAAETIDSVVIGADVAADYPGVQDWEGYFEASSVTLTVQGTPSTSAKDGSSGGAGQVNITYAYGQTLVAAVSPQAGTDQYGNAYVAGVSAKNLQLYGASTPSTPPANTTILFSDTGGSPSAKTSSGFTGQLPMTQCNIQTFSATSSYANLTASWSIPANDANVGTCYRVKVFGDASLGGATGEVLSFIPDAFGGSGSIGINFGALTPTSYYWQAELTVTIVTTGSSGTALFSISASISEAGDNGGQAGSVCTTSTVSVNTTASTTMTVQGKWGGGTTPSVSGISSTLERIGA